MDFDGDILVGFNIKARIDFTEAATTNEVKRLIPIF
jgi:hypothetical protein